MDWYPTVLELCGVKVPAGVELDGHSVLPMVEDQTASSLYSVMHWQWEQSWMVREANWKLLVDDRYALRYKVLDAVHLANLADEQPERRNHAHERPDIVERLDRIHKEWERDVTPKNVPELG